MKTFNTNTKNRFVTMKKIRQAIMDDNLLAYKEAFFNKFGIAE